LALRAIVGREGPQSHKKSSPKAAKRSFRKLGSAKPQLVPGDQLLGAAARLGIGGYYISADR
jgi:hypothetical protein